MKKLPVEVDVPELLVKQERATGASATAKAVGDLTLIEFYYLLWVGEYTVKGSRNDTKQTVQFKLEDVTFFKRNAHGQLRQVARNAPDHVVATTDGATLKLDNQKNGHKGVCINHEANGDPVLCPVRALGRRYCHIRQHAGGDYKTYLSAYWDDDTGRHDVTDKDISRALKVAADTLDCPHTWGVPLARVDTHSLRGGGANALSLNGYTDTQIQKLGCWRGETFKKYIQEELASFSVGMSKAMKNCLGYVNVSGGVFHMLPEDALPPLP
jgi:hypothetical protein